MSFLIKTIILPFVKMFIAKMLTKENIQIYGDKVFDLIEEFVADSKTTIDDTLVLPAIVKLRVLMDIPDFPDDIDPEDAPMP